MTTSRHPYSLSPPKESGEGDMFAWLAETEMRMDLKFHYKDLVTCCSMRRSDSEFRYD